MITQKKKYKAVILSAILSATISLSGCGLAAAGSAQTERTVQPTAAESTEQEIVVENTAPEVITENTAPEIVAESRQALETELVTDEVTTSLNLEDYQSDGGLTITAAGNYVLTGTLQGQITVNTTSDAKVRLILNGAEITSSREPCIYVMNADKVIVTSNKDSVSILKSEGTFSKSDENKADAVIFSQDDLTLTGEGIVALEATQGHGVVCKDNLAIKGGTWEITSGMKGICGKDSLTMEDGTVTVTAGTHAMESEGTIYIEDGTAELSSSGKDGIHSEGNVQISGGTIRIASSVEGVEGATVIISGGILEIVSRDDGINSSTSTAGQQEFAMGTNPFQADDSADITISGGEITINAAGDGIDSNGTLHMSGGAVWISGPENSGNGALDYGSEAIITGGTIVAVGAAGMAESFGTNSTQCSILYNCNSTYEAGTVVALYDENGTELISYAPEKSFSSVVISCPELTVGQTYTLVIGEDSAEVAMENVCYSTGGTGRDMPGKWNGPGGNGHGMAPGGAGGGMPGGGQGPGAPGGNVPAPGTQGNNAQTENSVS